MSKSCVYAPAKGLDTFRKLKKDFGYKQAAVIFNKITGTDFMRIYGDLVSVDSDGVPTYESIMELPVVKDYVGIHARIEAALKNFTPVEDTLNNSALLIKQAFEFNKGNKDLVAIVDYAEDGKIQVKIEEATQESKQIAIDQYRILQLNEKMEELLRPAGISIAQLGGRETALGRVGHTLFLKVQGRANEFTVLIEAANNFEGAHAISEEFAHYVIGVLNQSPLVSRSIEFLKDADNAQEVLGPQFELVYLYYQGNMTLVAEEAAGRILQKSLLKQANVTKTPLLQRMVNYIVNLFKNISPRVYKDSIDTIINQYDELARQILSLEKQITKKDINKAKRIVDFNALSEKVQALLDALNKFVVREYKAVTLIDNLDDNSGRTEKSKARQRADEVAESLKEPMSKEESMAAIATYLTSALQEITSISHSIENLENMTARDRFTILRNALIVIQKYDETIKDLNEIIMPAFLNDEEIAKQAFIVGDTSDALVNYEVQDPIEALDTAGKTISQIVRMIADESQKLQLSDDESYYVNSETGLKSARVTTVIEADLDGHKFDPNSPWKTPATNIGTGMDELVRDFISGRITKLASGDYVVEGKLLDEVYPNATKKQLQYFVNQLEAFKESVEAQGITLLSRDVTVDGTIETLDGTGRIHRVSVAGTLDLLGYDKEGNWHIYDMKTHRAKDISEESLKKYRRQLTQYKKFLELKYGIHIKDISILPIKVSYPTPEGHRDGTAKYEVSAETKPEGYNGAKNNQLIVNGEQFKDAYPKLEDVIKVEELDTDVQYSKLANDPTNGLGGSVQVVRNAVSNMQTMFDQFKITFKQHALPAFVKFLLPFVGENISIPDPENPGKFKTVSVELVLNKGNADATILQRYLSSMADNPDALLLIFDKIVKIAKDEKRVRMIEKALEITALGLRYEALGIKSYEWMFEDDKMNYINKLFDTTAYEKAKKAKMDELDSLYGKFPVIGTEEFKKKYQAKQQWIKENTEYLPDASQATPKASLYPSKYHRLTDAQKSFYDEWISIKDEMDNLIGHKRVALTNTIKIRRSNIERLHTLTDGSAIQSFVDNVKASTLKSFDDDYRGNKYGLKDFQGNEFMKLPLYYINAKPEDARDISTDVIGTLIAYADMAYTYDAMNQIVNPLEIGRELAKSREILELRNGKALLEKFRTRTTTHEDPIKIDTLKSKFMELLDEFFESKIYGRYLKDYDDLPGGIDKNKAASLLLKLGSTVQLGFNFLANISNVLTGISMLNIEAVAGEFFSARELAHADKEFGVAMGDFVGDLGRRAKQSKLALFDEMFDVRLNFSSDIRHKSFLNKNFLTRIFGPGIQYIGLDAGDHWLYNRTAIAMALRYKLIDTTTNKEISLWDALQVAPVDPNNSKAGNKLVVKPGVKKQDGSTFSIRDISDISGQMRYVNQHLFGIYNQEDSVGARRVILGRFLMLYRDWIPTQFRYRFGAMTTNLEKGKDAKVEGYYRTTGRFFKQLYTELRNGEKTISQVWDSLEDFEKRNLRRALAEVTLFAIISILCMILGKSKDKDRSWAKKMLRYALLRERTELGVLVPGPSMLSEGIKIIKSPMAAVNIGENIAGLAGLLWIPNYFDEIEQGDFKGHSTAYKQFFKSPFSLWYKSIKRDLDPDKAATQFD